MHGRSVNLDTCNTVENQTSDPKVNEHEAIWTWSLIDPVPQFQTADSNILQDEHVSTIRHDSTNREHAVQHKAVDQGRITRERTGDHAKQIVTASLTQRLAIKR
jgi:hypothetical protein